MNWYDFHRKQEAKFEVTSCNLPRKKRENPIKSLRNNSRSLVRDPNPKAAEHKAPTLPNQQGRSVNHSGVSITLQLYKTVNVMRLWKCCLLNERLKWR
jgi:hypothetical protein